MGHDIVIAAAQRGLGWFDGLLLLVNLLGVYILARYTVYTKRLVNLTKDALHEARNNNQASFAQTLESNKQTAESNRIAGDALELGRRAWLVAELKPEPNSPAFLVVARNVGGVPATDVAMWHKWEYIGSQVIPDDIIPVAGQVPDVGVVIGPGLSHKFQTEPFMALSKEQSDLLFVKQAVVYLYCEIVYWDVFNKARTTTACWIYAPDRTNEPDWTPAPKHNRLE